MSKQRGRPVPYRPLRAGIAGEPRFAQLPPSAKLLYYGIVSEDNNLLGMSASKVSYIGLNNGRSLADTALDLGRLVEAKYITAAEGVVLIKGQLLCAAIDNPNQAASAAKLLQAIPWSEPVFVQLCWELVDMARRFNTKASVRDVIGPVLHERFEREGYSKPLPQPFCELFPRSTSKGVGKGTGKGKGRGDANGGFDSAYRLYR